VPIWLALLTVDSAAPPAYSANGTEISPLDTIFGGPARTKGTFGEHLRREREMRGVSLQEVAQATRIGPRFLEALESERWQDLPGGVFNRGFLRSIARYLGLDEEALVAEYAQATNDHPQLAEWATSSGDGRAAPRARGGRRLAFLTTLLVIVAAGAGGWWGWTQYGPVLSAWWNPPPPVTGLKPPANPPSTFASVPGNGTVIIDADRQLVPAELELRVEVIRTTEVTIGGDGKTLFQGRMSRGESRLFKARERFNVSAKNSFALILELNGVSMPPMGQPDSPGSITLTRKDLAQPRGAAGESH